MSLFAALDNLGNTKYVGEVPRGAACGCFCAECRSPLVAKQGPDQIWHFAHEASQERPQCLPGSINLLRHLAISLLLAPDTMSLPECQHTMSLNRGYGALTGEAKWQLPIATIIERNLDAPYAKSVAAMQPVDLPDCRIGLWVQIGDLAIDDNGFFEGVLIYHCGAPSKGTITTHASAIEYLQNNSRMYWQRMPDVYGVLRQAQEELKQRLDAQEAHNHPFQGERLQSLSFARALMRQQISARWAPPPAVSPTQTKTDSPSWAKLKRKNSSYFAFRMSADTAYWVAMESADHEGYYVVPGNCYWDGWDEALPPSLGVADLTLGAYRGDGPVIQATQAMRRLGVDASRIDSDVSVICAFTGWQAPTE